MNNPYPIFKTSVVSGKFNTASHVKQAMKDYAVTLDDGNYYWVLKQHIPKRSIQMNRFYWGVILDILVEKTGYSKLILHNELLKEFSLVVDEDGKLVEQRSKHKNVVEFEEYLLMVISWVYETYPEISFGNPDDADTGVMVTNGGGDD